MQSSTLTPAPAPLGTHIYRLDLSDGGLAHVFHLDRLGQYTRRDAGTGHVSIDNCLPVLISAFVE